MRRSNLDKLLSRNEILDFTWNINFVSVKRIQKEEEKKNRKILTELQHNNIIDKKNIYIYIYKCYLYITPLEVSFKLLETK